MTIVALIILLMTPRALPNSYAFLLGWFTGLFLVGSLVLISPGFIELTNSPTSISGWVRIGLGTLFLTICIFLIKNLPKKGQETVPPKWLVRVDSYGPRQAISIGLFLSIVNVKNAAMVASGAVIIGAAGLGFLQKLILLVLFCLIASLGVLLVQVIFLIFRSAAESLLARYKVWLQRYSSLILMLVLISFGSWSLYRGMALLMQYGA
jgi:hypothetical protein